MREKIESKIRQAIRYADDVAAYEIVEELEDVLELLRVQACRESMEINGMTMYCGICCPDCAKAGKKFGLTPEHIFVDNGRNWFGNTGIQPSKAVSTG